MVTNYGTLLHSFFYKNNRFFGQSLVLSILIRLGRLWFLFLLAKIRTIVLVTNRNESHLVLFSGFFPLILAFFRFVQLFFVFSSKFWHV